MNDRKKRFSGISFSNGIGSSSLLVIFIILCLVSFATLSIVSANADYKLSSKVLERTTAYYEASNQAEHQLAELHQTLVTAYAGSSTEEEYYQITGSDISYLFPISDLQSLKVEVGILYPASAEGAFYQIRSWQVILTSDFEYEGTLDLFEPPWS
ncbi:MAG: hypothetical protein J1E65_09620 [Lachnospiraceae bacterium]|nr:hypothetical protein [Lachnospiraceae bacterium]